MREPFQRHEPERQCALIVTGQVADNGEVRFRGDDLGEELMAVFIDIYGNESRVLIDSTEFRNDRSNGKKAAAKIHVQKTTTKSDSSKMSMSKKKKGTRKRASA